MPNPRYVRENELLRRAALAAQEKLRSKGAKTYSPSKWVLKVEELRPLLSEDEWGELADTGLLSFQILDALCGGSEVEFA